MRTPVSVGVVVGLDSGRRLARTFAELPQADLRWTCGDRIRLRADTAGPRGVRQTSAYADLLSDESLDAIVLAVPVAVRYELALAALQADKHVYVAGASATKSDQAHALIREARRRGRQLVEGHACLFDPAVHRLKALIQAGRLGEVFYLRVERNALQAVVGSGELLWSVGADDIALVLDLVGDEPVDVSAVGETYLDGDSPDVLDCRLGFSTGIAVQVHLSALDARLTARLSVVGSASTAVFDDTALDRRLTLFDRTNAAGLAGSEAVAGDVVSPQIPVADALQLSCEHFLTTVRSSSDELPPGGSTRVVDVLDALQRSLPRREAGGRTGAAAAPRSRELRLVEAAP
jgi:predicted dehydrogenase